MKKMKQTLEGLGLEKQITLTDLPDIDLYIDQVIQLFENTFGSVRRNDEDKVLTKTMINNYAKGKIFIPIKNKKYSKEHLILISLIYHLKGGLTLNDIKATLHGINKRIMEENIDLNGFYQSYLDLYEENAERFAQEAGERITAANKEAEKFANEEGDYIEKVLNIISFITMSNFYRRMAEKYVDEIIEEMNVIEPEKKQEKKPDKKKQG